MTLPYICFASSQGSNDYRGCLGPIYYNLFDTRLHAVETIFPVETQNGKGLQKLFAHQKNHLIHALKENNVSFVFSGDHSSAMGTWQYMLEQHPDMHLIWVDAHLDAHNPVDTVSDNIHGMPIAYMLGDFQLEADMRPLTHPLKGENIHIIGARSYAPIELKKMREHGVNLYLEKDMLATPLENIFHQVKAKIGHKPYGISLDLDIIDPTHCPGVNCPSDGGIIPEALLTALPIIFEECKLLELTEYNPARDTDHQTRKIISHILDDYLNARINSERASG